MLQIVAEAGSRVDIIMIPKVEGPWDIFFVDQLLAQLEAKYGVKKPILVHALLETAQGVKNVDEIAATSPRMEGMSLGPADLAASRGMKTTRVGGGHPSYGVLADSTGGNSHRPFFQQDLWHYTIGRMVDACMSSTGLSAISRTRLPAKPNFGMPFSWVAWEPGRCTRAKSPLPGACSVRM
jgi:malyl-CoA/(S)-citramalyl-CoA lyase